MPWEKAFDEDKVVGKAMTLFWEKGYEATSISDLIATTGVNRGSLYNAFGGKRQFFELSLLKYDTENRRATLAQLEALDNPVEAIRAFFDAIVRETSDDIDKKGCFLVNTTLELPAHDDKVREIVTNGLAEIEAFFKRCLEVAQARGEVASTVKAAVTAKVLLSLVVAIRVLGRGAYEESALTDISTQALQLITE